MRFIESRGRRALLITALLMFVASSARAFPVTSCGTTCSSNCELAANLVCTPTQIGVTLTNGADLDMRGFDIRCEIDDDDPIASYDRCAKGIRVTGANSTVFSSGPGDPADPTPRVRGPWLNAIDCTGSTNSSVLGITIYQALLGGSGHPADPAVNACAIVEDSTIIGKPVAYPISDGNGGARILYKYPSVGIWLANNSVRTYRNYIDGFGYAAIFRTPKGNAPVDAEDNAINYRDLVDAYIANAYAIDFLRLTNDFYGVFFGNVIVGDGMSNLFNSSPGTIGWGNNTCRRGLANCEQCVTSFDCFASSPCVSP